MLEMDSRLSAGALKQHRSTQSFLQAAGCAGSPGGTDTAGKSSFALVECPLGFQSTALLHLKRMESWGAMQGRLRTLSARLSWTGPSEQGKFILTTPLASYPYCSSICYMPLGTCFCREFWPSVWCRSGKSPPSSDEESRSPLAGGWADASAWLGLNHGSFQWCFGCLKDIK